MSDHTNPTDAMIEKAMGKLRELLIPVTDTKKFINQLCAFDGREPMFPDSDLVTESVSSVPTAITRNVFYGRGLATCVKEFLKMREKKTPRESTLNEIIEALRQGGYDLSQHGRDTDGQKRGVAISLAKNNVAFHKLPNEDFGLTEWYSNIRSKKQKHGAKGDISTSDAAEDATTDDTAQATEVVPTEAAEPETTNPEETN
ncbi:hypothetical protein [Prosthecobacter sp.]|uniref:hypothetical protein n=1 Tax=Prosthecobacter sp. TaxID=1965333 RepID=UPI00248808D7|nr:hypothetical protein [Prosthecobacter sp.]MDI1311380.1 hypothetical protein [Prosthecobacter sp.]